MLLEVRGLEVHYGGIRAVKGIDLDVAPGELVCLIGANGAGKTSTLKAICRLLPSASKKRSEERRVGKSVDLGGRRIIKKKRRKKMMEDFVVMTDDPKKMRELLWKMPPGTSKRCNYTIKMATACSCPLPGCVRL